MKKHGTSASFTIGIILVILKLVNVINWSWWLVLLPFYGLFVILIGFAMFVFLVVLIKKDK